MTSAACPSTLLQGFLLKMKGPEMKIDDPRESINLLVRYMVVEFSIWICGKLTSDS